MLSSQLTMSDMDSPSEETVETQPKPQKINRQTKHKTVCFRELIDTYIIETRGKSRECTIKPPEQCPTKNSKLIEQDIREANERWNAFYDCPNTNVKQSNE